jgi:hypothetical protein
MYIKVYTVMNTSKPQKTWVPIGLETAEAPLSLIYFMVKIKSYSAGIRTPLVGSGASYFTDEATPAYLNILYVM